MGALSNFVDGARVMAQLKGKAPADAVAYLESIGAVPINNLPEPIKQTEPYRVKDGFSWTTVTPALLPNIIIDRRNVVTTDSEVKDRQIKTYTGYWTDSKNPHVVYSLYLAGGWMVHEPEYHFIIDGTFEFDSYYAALYEIFDGLKSRYEGKTESEVIPALKSLGFSCDLLSYTDESGFVQYYRFSHALDHLQFISSIAGDKLTGFVERINKPNTANLSYYWSNGLGWAVLTMAGFVAGGYNPWAGAAVSSYQALDSGGDLGDVLTLVAKTYISTVAGGSDSGQVAAESGSAPISGASMNYDSFNFSDGESTVAFSDAQSTDWPGSDFSSAFNYDTAMAAAQANLPSIVPFASGPAPLAITNLTLENKTSDYGVVDYSAHNGASTVTLADVAKGLQVAQQAVSVYGQVSAVARGGGAKAAGVSTPINGVSLPATSVQKTGGPLQIQTVGAGQLGAGRNTVDVYGAGPSTLAILALVGLGTVYFMTRKG